MITAVLFDIDGVLLDSFEANLKFYQDLMQASGYRPPTREEFPELFHLALWDGIKILTKSPDEKEIERIWEMGRTKQVPYQFELLKTPAGAEETIKTLAQSYYLGIVTSRVRENIYSVPSLAALRAYFKVAISYQDTKRHKPDPEPLLLAASRLNAAPENAVYIGDVENDVKAGKAAGMKVIIYSKNAINGADACITSFAELPKYISLL
ncbi:HAD family hydrolase [Candidatus Uhrbacteria bacterium]|nr:HAD family hydrolase [Candidatus Uhrbacteria bacterium]